MNAQTFTYTSVCFVFKKPMTFLQFRVTSYTCSTEQVQCTYSRVRVFATERDFVFTCAAECQHGSALFRVSRVHV